MSSFSFDVNLDLYNVSIAALTLLIIVAVIPSLSLDCKAV
jgi:hypothetical protein